MHVEKEKTLARSWHANFSCADADVLKSQAEHQACLPPVGGVPLEVM